MGLLENLKNKSKQAAIVKGADYIVRYIQKDPDKHFDTMMKILYSLDTLFGNKGRFRTFMEWTNNNPGSRIWFTNLMTREPGQVSAFVRNYLGNCSLKWMEIADETVEKHGFCPPYSILVSPTMRCNLKCKGCYAESFRQDDDLDLATLDKIITEGKELGVFFYTILGGEPFLRFDDIETVAAKHADCLFQLFSNGTLINEDVADRLYGLKNVVVAFSINGTREDTVYMRGNGVYEKVLDAMALLKKRRQIYGISLTLTSKNYDTLMSREFLKFWEEQGVVFGWDFLFMPVGKNPDLSLMPTPQQRVSFGEFIKKYREQEPFYLMDFWADAPAINGCISAGRRFLHINSNGDIEPCIFAHFSTHNIKDCHLIDALQSPFFTFIRMNQPHTDNLLRPCMIIDNPEILREACRRFHAKPTEDGAERLIHDPELMQALDRYSEEASRVIDPVWREKYTYKIDSMYARKRSYGEGIDRIEYKLNRLPFLEKIKQWAQENPAFARAMLDGLEFSSRRYGTDPKRHSLFIKPVKTKQQKEDELSI